MTGYEFQMSVAEQRRLAFLRDAAAVGDAAVAADLGLPRTHWTAPEATHNVVAASLGVSPDALASYNAAASARLNSPIGY